MVSGIELDIRKLIQWPGRSRIGLETPVFLASGRHLRVIADGYLTQYGCKHR